MRLQESMLLVPITARASFWAMKFISLVDFEQEKKPMELPPWVSRAVRNPSAARLERFVPRGRTKHAVVPYERLCEPLQRAMLVTYHAANLSERSVLRD